MAAKKEWTRNRGKQPVGGSVWVEVRYRDGAIEKDVAGNYRWAHTGKDHPTGCVDIMAWRRVRAPRKPAAIAPEHAPRPAVPEAKPVPELVYPQSGSLYEFPTGKFDAPRRPRLMHAVLAIIVAVGLIGAVCYVF